MRGWAEKTVALFFIRDTAVKKDKGKQRRRPEVALMGWRQNREERTARTNTMQSFVVTPTMVLCSLEDAQRRHYIFVYSVFFFFSASWKAEPASKLGESLFFFCINTGRRSANKNVTQTYPSTRRQPEWLGFFACRFFKSFVYQY